uniref:Telomere repeat binding bouquet formation protein 1 n=1 Tax=Poecilia latipinna TaxID=48699 RepID=A0A3B3UFR6_9TELE
CVSSKAKKTSTKTDLSLLLECVKFQMKCPDSQKQALLTIHSICEKRGNNETRAFRLELGGVSFLYNLSKSSNVHSDVKETALFTLGTLAEANVYCKNSLCRKDIFIDIAGHLQEDSPLNKKRVSVYLLFVLVAHNKLGQTLAQTTGCLEILMDLFRYCVVPLMLDNLRTVSQNYQLWTSVSSALCGSVNNPQNEEGQRICVAAFPIVKTWLQQISVPSTETFQPICSFIAMTVSNNSYVQESFAACGGLETLTLALLRVVSAAGTSLLSRQLSVVIVKTLSACITDNLSFQQNLSYTVFIPYGLVYHLFFLLTSSHFDPDDRLSVLLAIGECTEASEEHQSQLVDCGGLPIMITFLTEDSSEDVRKAATFILQTCKKARSFFNLLPFFLLLLFLHGYTRRNPLCISCVLTFEEVTSRSFASVQSSCVNSCDMHRVLQEATERFRMHRFNFGVRREQKSVTKEHSDTNSARVSTTKLHRSCENMGGRRLYSCKLSCKILRRKRQDFSGEEVHHLLSGVRKYGYSWNFILWSYPFQPGRTNVDLAKKYRRLMRQQKS